MAVNRLVAVLAAFALTVTVGVISAPAASADWIRPSVPCAPVAVGSTFLGDRLTTFPDTYRTPVNRALFVPSPGLLSNDSRVTSGGVITGFSATGGWGALLWSEPAHGSVRVNSDGSFTYQADVSGATLPTTDSFEYYAWSEWGVCSEPTLVTINFAPWQDVPTSLPPVGNSDTYPIDGEPVLLSPFDVVPTILTDLPPDRPYDVPAPGVLANDVNPYSPTESSGNLQAILLEGPTWHDTGQPAGSFTRWGTPGSLGNDGGFTYTPNLTNFGVARFRYRLCYQILTGATTDTCSDVDSYLRVARSVETLPDDLVADPLLPTLVDQSDPETPLPSPIRGNDVFNVPGDTAEFTQPSHGALTQLFSATVYSAEEGFTGVDSFTYRRCAEKDSVRYCSEWTPIRITVGGGQQAQSLDFSVPAQLPLGDSPLTLTGVATSGLPVSYAVQTPGVCSVSGDQLTLLHAGTCTVTASQPGNASYLAAPDVTRTIQVDRQTVVLHLGGPASLTLGDEMPLTITADSGAPPGNTLITTSTPLNCSVTYPAGKGLSVKALAGTGECVLRVDAPSTPDFAYTPDEITIPLERAAQSITFPPIDDRALDAGPFTVAASSTSGLAVALAANGNCTVEGMTVTPTDVGACTIEATQAGNGDYEPAEPVTRSFEFQSMPRLTQLPEDAYVTAGGTATFTAAATGYPAPRVQWYRVTDGPTVTEIPDATGATLTLPDVSLAQDGEQYIVRFSNPAGSTNSGIVTLHVLPAAPVVTTQPQDATVRRRGPVTFTAEATGAPTPTVQWQQSRDRGRTWRNIRGGISATLTITRIDDDLNGARFRAVFTNVAGKAVTRAAILSIRHR